MPDPHRAEYPLPKAYTVALFFDATTEAALRQAWAEVNLKAGLRDKITALTGSRPHISLGTFDEGDLAEVVAALAGLAAGQQTFEVSFESIGIFSARGILFLGPAVNRQLLDLHAKCHREMAGLVHGWANNYLPEKLVFHASVNLGLEKEELLRAVRAALDIPMPIPATVERLGILKLPGGDFNPSFPLSGQKQDHTRPS